MRHNNWAKCSFSSIHQYFSYTHIFVWFWKRFTKSLCTISFWKEIKRNRICRILTHILCQLPINTVLQSKKKSCRNPNNYSITDVQMYFLFQLIALNKMLCVFTHQARNRALWFNSWKDWYAKKLWHFFYGLDFDMDKNKM